jgi:hypothetical protein
LVAHEKAYQESGPAQAAAAGSEAAAPATGQARGSARVSAPQGMETKMSEYNKAWVSLVMAILVIINQIWGVDLGLNEEKIGILLAVIWPILVWLVPNR